MELKPIDFNHPNAAQDFVVSLHHTGFGVLANHPIRPELLDEFYAKWLQLFS